MSIFDGKRIDASLMNLDIFALRQGHYADKYFENTQLILQTLQDNGYRYQGDEIGDLEVEAQWFMRRQPFAVIGGVDVALEMLRQCTGYFDKNGAFVNTFAELGVEAVEDGVLAHYSGDPMHVEPVLKVRGIYKHFGVLETTTLGVLSRISRIATNTYHLMKAAAGKPVLFFPARYDLYQTQAADGYAYHLGVQRFNTDTGHNVGTFVSTDGQGAWYGGKGGGTVPHAMLAAFRGDTPEAMLQFAEILPAVVPRIALVDFHNDCVTTATAVASAMFARFRTLVDEGNLDTAEKYRLNGVRLDTGGTVRDVSVLPLGDPVLDFGVNARLVHQVREALNNLWRQWDLPTTWQERARAYCKDISIVATGGFSIDKIRTFERLGIPVDTYGVGSKFFLNDSGTNTDFTMDVVRINVGGQWLDMAKVGRQSCRHLALKPVT